MLIGFFAALLCEQSFPSISKKDRVKFIENKKKLKQRRTALKEQLKQRTEAEPLFQAIHRISAASSIVFIQYYGNGKTLLSQDKTLFLIVLFQ